MARYKPYSYSQGKFIPVYFEKQILPRTFEYSLNHLVDHKLDLSIFDERYRNEETGATAYDPRILLKIILFAYSRGIVSSRRIAQVCEENIIFMALSCDTKPHFTTIADFVSTMDKEITRLFREVLLVCDDLGLIGKEMFAIDGCKLPSNASKEWSGTKADFEKKAAKMERAIENILKKHREEDQNKTESKVKESEEKFVETLNKRVSKIREWLNRNEDKPGKTGKPRKSNITDNESAKMKTHRGVVQGYDGVAATDSKHQVIIQAEAFGEAQEHDLLEPMVEGVRKNFQEISKEDDVFEKAKLLADSGFHTEKNMEMLAVEGIDAYVADNRFRKRDPRFTDYEKYKDEARKDWAKGKPKLFRTEDFIFDQDMRYCICPAGKRLYRSGADEKAHRFKGTQSSCVPCKLRAQCIRNPGKTVIRQAAHFAGRTGDGPTFTDRMKRKIDSTVGRVLYGMRLAISEPPFSHITSILGLDRFTLRGKTKVNTQWNLFCIVHNMTKIHRYGLGYA
ncbi:MAG: IS1182 family transposase [Syntrophales bacterium]